MFDKIAAALSAVALGAGVFAVYKVESAPTAALPTAAIDAAVAKAVAERSADGATPSDAAIEAFLMENPQVMMASLEKFQLEARAAEQREQTLADVKLVNDNSDEIFRDGYSFVGGNPDGDITLVEFSDYNCGYCKRAHSEVKKLIEADGNIRLVVKEFPILGPGSVLAGKAALASKMQDDGEKYAAFNDALITHRGSHNEASVMRVAEKVGLDVDQLKVDMKSPEIDKMVKRTTDLAEILSIRGTPAFVIGDQVVRGFVPAEDLERLTAAARES